MHSSRSDQTKALLLKRITHAAPPAPPDVGAAMAALRGVLKMVVGGVAPIACHQMLANIAKGLPAYHLLSAEDAAALRNAFAMIESYLRQRQHRSALTEAAARLPRRPPPVPNWSAGEVIIILIALLAGQPGTVAMSVPAALLFPGRRDLLPPLAAWTLLRTLIPELPADPSLLDAGPGGRHHAATADGGDSIDSWLGPRHR